MPQLDNQGGYRMLWLSTEPPTIIHFFGRMCVIGMLGATRGTSIISKYYIDKMPHIKLSNDKHFIKINHFNEHLHLSELGRTYHDEYCIDNLINILAEEKYNCDVITETIASTNHDVIGNTTTFSLTTADTFTNVDIYCDNTTVKLQYVLFTNHDEEITFVTTSYGYRLTSCDEFNHFELLGSMCDEDGNLNMLGKIVNEICLVFITLTTPQNITLKYERCCCGVPIRTEIRRINELRNPNYVDKQIVDAIDDAKYVNPEIQTRLINIEKLFNYPNDACELL